MPWKHRSGGSWSTLTPKTKENGQWVEMGGGSGDGSGEYEPSGYPWDKTFTDYSWLTDADANDNLNVEKVTTTDPTGTGSLDEAINNAASYPTVVVFEVGGVIDLDTAGEYVWDASGPVWIAGETAPDPGITIVRNPVSIYSSDVIVTHLSFLMGDRVDDGLVTQSNLRGTDGPNSSDDPTHLIIDHCTMMWGTDQNLGFGDCTGTSVLNCIVAEGLYDSIHPEGTHSCGLLFNDEVGDVTVAGNLFAHNNRRNPLNRTDCFLVNNYIYNFRHNLIHTDNANPTFTSIGNYIEDGDDSQTGRQVHKYTCDLYYDDIVLDGADRPMVDGDVNVLSSPPVVPPDVTISEDVMAGVDVRSWAREQAGARPANRPPVEADLVDNRLTSGHGIVDSQDEVGGYPEYSTTTRSLDVPSTGIVEWIKTNHTAVVEGTV